MLRSESAIFDLFQLTPSLPANSSAWSLDLIVLGLGLLALTAIWLSELQFVTECFFRFLGAGARESTPTAVLRGGATGDKDRPLYDIGQATERVAAAAEAARALPFPFTLTARTESFLRGDPNLDDVIKRMGGGGGGAELHGRNQGQVVHCRRARSPAREIRHLRVHRPLYSDTRSRRLHAGLTATGRLTPAGADDGHPVFSASYTLASNRP